MYGTEMMKRNGIFKKRKREKSHDILFLPIQIKPIIYLKYILLYTNGMV